MGTDWTKHPERKEEERETQKRNWEADAKLHPAAQPLLTGWRSGWSIELLSHWLFGGEERGYAERPDKTGLGSAVPAWVLWLRPSLHH